MVLLTAATDSSSSSSSSSSGRSAGGSSGGRDSRDSRDIDIDGSGGSLALNRRVFLELYTTLALHQPMGLREALQVTD